MSSNCKELRVSKSDKGDWLFSSDCYIVPLYQREYAWRNDVEIDRLIADIAAFDPENDPNCCYRLGSISVMQREHGEFEVIDGQQRLTTLYLLLTALNSVDNTVDKPNPDKDSLTFEGRTGSTYTLKNLETIYTAKAVGTGIQIDTGIADVYAGLRAWAHSLKQEELDNFVKRLQQTAIYRIPVPNKTDLCKFFIRMNTRGKQLELSDVLKAQLMKHLNPNDLAWFNAVWTDCSNMNTYLKKSLPPEIWLEFFNPEALSSNSFSRTGKMENSTEVATTKQNLLDFTNKCLETNNFRTDSSPSEENTFRRADFESFIDFPTFLMHTLKLCALNKSIKTIGSTTNDKRLLSFFEEYWKPIFGVPLNTETASQEDPNLQEDQSLTSRNAVLNFLRTLVIARHLYDGWILKRLDKTWIIKRREENADERNTDKMVNSYSEELHKKILMIQSCLRVTYTSSHTMPWVTELLQLLWEHRTNPDAAGEAVLELLESFAAKEVNDKWSLKDQGTGTPRILFNFLNYLLWRDGIVSNNEEDKKRQEKFQFAYWNSVEHWYPQSPDHSNDEWPNAEPSVDTFGNLFLLNGSDNSSLSNMLPSEKRRRLEDKVANKNLMLSLKAVDMMRATEKAQASKETWQKTCYELEKKHLDFLKRECERCKCPIKEEKSENSPN